MDVNQLMGNIGIAADIAQAVAIMIGIGLVFTAFFQLKRYTEMRTFMSHQMTIAQPLMLFLGGVLFLSLPTTISSAMLAVWGTDQPLSYTGPTTNYQELIPPIIMFVRFIGVCAVMKGIMLFARSGDIQTPAGTVAKAISHVIGGLLCIHILGAYQLLLEIFGFST